MLKIFRNFKGKEWVLFTISIIFVVSQVWLDLKLPDYMSEITQLVQTPGSEMREILTSGGWMLLCALGSLVASIIVAALAAKIAANLSARLRFKMFDKVQSFSGHEILVHGLFRLHKPFCRYGRRAVHSVLLPVAGSAQ